MTRIFLSTLSLCLLLLQLNLSKAQPGSPQKLPFTFHSLFPFFGRPEDANIPLKGPQDDLQNVPQQAADQKPQKLSPDFYIKTCPNAQKIVADALADIVKKNPGALGNLLRLQFHDCFVNVSFFLLSYTIISSIVLLKHYITIKMPLAVITWQKFHMKWNQVRRHRS